MPLGCQVASGKVDALIVVCKDLRRAGPWNGLVHEHRTGQRRDHLGHGGPLGGNLVQKTTPSERLSAASSSTAILRPSRLEVACS